MRIRQLPQRATLAVAMLLVAHTTSASGESKDEIVVSGTATELALDVASLRVDVKRHAAAIAASVRDALVATESRVAAANTGKRG